MTTRIAVTVAAWTAIACGGGGAHPATPPAPIGNQGRRTVVVEAPAGDPRCGRATEAEVPPIAATAHGEDVARGIIVDGLGHPIDGASVVVTGGERHETRDGHALTLIQGTSSTWTDAAGGFAVGGLSEFMDQLTVEFGGVKVTCERPARDSRPFKIIVQPAAI